MSSRQKKSALLFFLLVTLLLPATVYLVVAQPVPFLTSLAVNITGPRIYLWPSSGALREGQEIEFEVRLDTGQQQVKKAQVVLSYNPDFFENRGVFRPGSVFNRYYGENWDAGSGVISLGGAGSFQGSGTYLTVTLTPRKKGFSKIKLAEVSVDGASLDSADYSYTIY